MALHIRDKETDQLVRQLADRRGIRLTDAIKTAVKNELCKDEKPRSLWEKLRPLHQRVAARGATGLEADKAFFDDLSGDP